MPPITFPNFQNPFGIAIAPTASRAYVTFTNTDEVGIIDTTNNTYIGAIPITLGKTKSGIISATPYAIAIDPISNKAYVANKWSDTVSILDLNRGSEIKALPVGSISGAVLTYTNDLIAIDTSINRVYVSNTNSNNITVIDTTTDTVMGNIPTGVNPSGLALALPFNVTPVTPPTTNPPPPPNVTLSSIAIQPSAYTLPVASDTVFKATANYSDGSTQDITNIAVWSLPTVVSNGVSVPIASILNSVLVGLNAGNGNITISYGGKTGTATLTVTPEVPTNIILTPLSPVINYNQTQQFIATALYKNGRSLDVTADPQIVWKSGDITVGMMSNTVPGLAKGIKTGVSNIWVTYNGVAYPFTTLTVNPVMTITVAPNPAPANVGDIVTFTAMGAYDDPSLPPKDLTNLAMWNSNNNMIASFGGYPKTNNQATVNNQGTATITATWSTPYGQTAIGSSVLSVGGTTTCRQFPQLYQFTGWQVDPPDYNNWANYLYAHHTALEPVIAHDWSGTIVHDPYVGYLGCSLVCYSMILTTINPELTPGKLNEVMLSKGYYSSDNFTQPPALVALSKDPITGIHKITYADHTTYDYNTWKTELDNCSVIIAHTRGSQTVGHYVLVVGYNKDNKFIAYDPARHAVQYIDTTEIITGTDNGHILVKFK